MSKPALPNTIGQVAGARRLGAEGRVPAVLLNPQRGPLKCVGLWRFADRLGFLRRSSAR